MDLSNENVIHIKNREIEYLQFRRLLEYPEVMHAYSLGMNTNFRTAKSGNEYEKAIEDYKKLCNAIGLNYKNIVKPVQCHTNEVKIVDELFERPDIGMQRYARTDGLITNKKDMILSTTNADCILFLFYDTVKKVIANVHSGWRGTLTRISVKTIEKMKQQYNCNPEDIIVCICPSIRKCHFEVEIDVKDLFEKEFQDIKEINSIIEEKVPNKKWHIDTIEINKILMQREGIKEENIIDSKICSVCNKELVHSYRAEGKSFALNTALLTLK